MQGFYLFVARLCTTGANFQEIIGFQTKKIKQTELFVCCSVGRATLLFLDQLRRLRDIGRDPPRLLARIG
jgi:hypothetical protein